MQNNLEDWNLNKHIENQKEEDTAENDGKAS